MRDRLTSRTENSVSTSSSAPGWSSAMNATSDVLSRPLGSGGSAGRLTSTKRVTASGLSSMSAASTVSR